VAHRRVDQQQPRRREDEDVGEPGALGISPDDQRRRDDGERHLEHEEHGFGDRSGLALRRDAVEERLVEAAPESVARPAIAERDGVADEKPEQRHQAGDDDALRQHGEHVLRLHQAAVKQGQRRQGHQQHKRGGGQNPGRVAGVGLGEGRGSGQQGDGKASDRSAAGFKDGHGVPQKVFADCRGVARCLGASADSRP